MNSCQINYVKSERDFCDFMSGQDSKLRKGSLWVADQKAGKERKTEMSFKSGQKKIAKKSGMSMKSAGAVLAKSSRNASASAKRKKPETPQGQRREEHNVGAENEVKWQIYYWSITAIPNMP